MRPAVVRLASLCRAGLLELLRGDILGRVAVVTQALHLLKVFGGVIAHHTALLASSVEDNLTKLIQPRTAEKEKAGNVWVVRGYGGLFMG